MSIATYNSRLANGRKLLTISGPIVDVKAFYAGFLHQNPRAKPKSETYQHDLGRAVIEVFVPEEKA